MFRNEVQINGKVRSQIAASAGDSEEVLRETALKDEKIVKWLEGKEPKKVIVVPGKVVNIVV